MPHIIILFKYSDGGFNYGIRKDFRQAERDTGVYQKECYKVLFEHFSDAKTFLKQKQAIIEKKVMEYQDCQRRFKDAQKLMNKAKAELNQVMKYTIEDWRENNRQLNLPFAI